MMMLLACYFPDKGTIMTFSLTYEELLARNERLENALLDTVSSLLDIERAQSGHFASLELAVWDISVVRSKLEKALQ